jgi:hypothetical protein
MPTDQDDIAYYQRRIAACDSQAATSTCPSARRAHEMLSQLYTERLLVLRRRVSLRAGAVAVPAPVVERHR